MAKKPRIITLGKASQSKIGMQFIINNQLVIVWADHLVRLNKFVRENAKNIYRFEGAEFLMSFNEQLAVYFKPHAIAAAYGLMMRRLDKKTKAYMKHPAATNIVNGKTRKSA